MLALLRWHNNISVSRSFENNWNTYKLLAHVHIPEVKVSFFLCNASLVTSQTVLWELLMECTHYTFLSFNLPFIYSVVVFFRVTLMWPFWMWAHHVQAWTRLWELQSGLASCKATACWQCMMVSRVWPKERWRTALCFIITRHRLSCSTSCWIRKIMQNQGWCLLHMSQYQCFQSIP